MTVDDLDTPALLIDLDVVDRNIARLQAYCNDRGLSLRPHIKTHKIPALAHRQLAAGARGITCQKIGEAEVMAAAGITDILITFNLVGTQKIERLARLLRQARMRVTADAHEILPGLGAAARTANTELPVLVECDTGLGRNGVQTPREAVAMAQAIAAQEGLRFLGLMTYPTPPAGSEWMAEALALLEHAGLPPEVVSAGGTVEATQTHMFPEMTEIRAGNYLYNDLTTVARGGASLADCAQRVLATVTNRPTPTRAILDTGSKSLTSDPLRGGGHALPGHGHIAEYPEALIGPLSEEHAIVDLSRSERVPALGERVQVIANHCCTVSNLFDLVYAHRGGVIEAIWPVAARGKVQ